jgi:hypothetical protein
MTGEVVLFAGPSTHGLRPDEVAASVDRWLPPARRGDVAKIATSPAGRRDPGVIVLCDGVFQSVPAVSHAELCDAIDGGWRVWGVSSLGAIRAWEMRDEGMHGAGWVYERLATGEDLPDDEMALLHYPEAPWFPLSEALVNVRFALEASVTRGDLDAAAARHVIDALGRLWFGDRTEDRLRALLRQATGWPDADVEAWLDGLRARRVKALDLRALLRVAPWRPPGSRAGAARPG